MSKRLHPLLLIVFAVTSANAQDAAPVRKATITDVHKTVITPASDALFKAETSPPKSEKQWNELQRNAAALGKSATSLMSKEIARDQKEWALLSHALRTEANSAAVAARQKDVDELVAANGRIVAICESCHDDYRDNGHGMTSDKQRAP
jgi:cytochrome c556